MLSMLKSLIIYTINKKMQNINIMYMWNIHVNSYFIKKKKKKWDANFDIFKQAKYLYFELCKFKNSIKSRMIAIFEKF